MVQPMFDTHKLIKQLINDGFKESQAESVVRVVTTGIENAVTPEKLNETIKKEQEHFATKSDLAEVRNEVSDFKVDSQKSFSRLETMMHSNMRWIIGINITAMGLLFTGLKLF